MSRILARPGKFARDEEGASPAEYGPPLAPIAVVCTGAITVLGTNISQMFASLAGLIGSEDQAPVPPAPRAAVG